MRPGLTIFLRVLVVVTLVLASYNQIVLANPEPEIPLHVRFNKDGTCTLTVEVDPRCFTADPMHERYLMKVDLTHQTAQELDQVKAEAANAVKAWILVLGEPGIPLKPEFQYQFTGQKQALLQKPDDPVVVTGTWHFPLPAALSAVRVESAKDARYSVVVSFSYDGIQQPKLATLFPGEQSFAIRVPAKDSR
jgi:hypothetical protein